MEKIKYFWNNVTPLAIGIFIIGLIVIILTAWSFNLSGHDVQLSNQYGDLSEQIRNLDAHSSAIIVGKELGVFYQRDAQLEGALVASKLFTQTSPDTYQRAYESIQNEDFLLGLPSPTTSIKDITSSASYWNAIQSSIDLLNNAFASTTTQTGNDITLIQGQQTHIRNNQQSIERDEGILFWATIVLTLLNVVLGLRLVLVDHKGQEITTY